MDRYINREIWTETQRNRKVNRNQTNRKTNIHTNGHDETIKVFSLNGTLKKKFRFY